MRRGNRYLRIRDRQLGHRRPKGPPPTEGWLIAELAALVDLGLRAVRYYLERGGLELMVKADASPLVRRDVREMHEHCVGSS